MQTPETPIEHIITPDAKGDATALFKEVTVRTRDNFPDSRFTPETMMEIPTRELAQKSGAPFYRGRPEVDGTGTKPQNSARLSLAYPQEQRLYGSSFSDAFAMVKGDIESRGGFMFAASDSVDMNYADPAVTAELVAGCENACREGSFALVTGEVAELRATVSGPGLVRVNINATGESLFVHGKELGKEMEPGLPVVGFREETFRSNGNTMNNRIMEAAYLYRMGAVSKEEMVYKFCRSRGVRDPAQFMIEMSRYASHDMIEQFFLPWHEMYPHVARELARPSNLYGTVMYEAQGGVDGDREVNMLAAAHITGGGIPLKAYRMMKSFGLGVDINNVFPEPRGVQMVKQTYDSLPENMQQVINLTEKRAIETWNSGVGFMVVVGSLEDADHLIEIAEGQGTEAAVIGRTIDRRAIQFKGHTWRYA